MTERRFICRWCEREIWDVSLPEATADDRRFVDEDGVSTCPLRHMRIYHQPLLESRRAS